MRKKFVLLLSLFFIFLLTTVCQGKMYSIASKEVNMRTGPGKKYSISWAYGKGFPLTRLAQKGNWVKVKDFENDSGWIYKPLLSSKPHMVVKVFKNKNQTINIRSGPGRKYKVVGKAYYGVVFETLERRKTWVKVKHESGLTGWVARKLLWGF